jgi:hypothetical protein
MKKRLKVLSSQADYTRFRSQYQAEQIERHHRIHESALAERRDIDERLKTMLDAGDKRENSEKVKQETRERLTEAYDRLKEERLEQRNEIKKRTERNMEMLARRRAKELEERRARREEVARMESGIRDHLQRYSQEKQEGLREVREREKQGLMQYSSEMARQVEQLAQREKELIEANSQSMQSSRLIDLQFKKLYVCKPNQHSPLLPNIGRKSPSNATTTALE